MSSSKKALRIIIIVSIAAVLQFTLMGMGLSWYIETEVMPKTYTAYSVVIIQSESNSNSDSSSITSTSEDIKLRNSFIKVATYSPDLTSLMSGAKVIFEAPEESSLIKIITTSSNPQVAANISNQLAEQMSKTFASLYGKDKGLCDTIRSANAPNDPSYPDMGIFLLVGAIAGFLIGSLLAFLVSKSIYNKVKIKENFGANYVH